MNALKDYDVLRLIEHNQVCYVSSDNVKGCPLAKWMKYHPYISKQRVNQWIHEIVRQVMQIHKCRGNPSYQYVNPYSIIVTDGGKLCFLDIGADSNKDIIRIMKRKSIREYFLPRNNMDNQKASEELDIYGIGKTLQYLLSFVEVLPGFTRKEEKNLQKMITGCIHPNRKKRFKNISDIQKYLPEIRTT